MTTLRLVSSLRGCALTKLLVVITTIRIAALLLLPVRAGEFEIEGQVISVEDLAGVQSSITNSFLIAVSNCNWFIRIVYQNARVGYQEVACVEDVIYSLISREAWAEKQALAGQPVGANKADASIMEGNMPLRSGATASPVLWLAYCSGCLLDTAKDGKLVPVFRSDVSPRFLKPLSTEIVRQDLWPGLPTLMTFFDDGVDHRYGRKRQPPFDRGFVLAEYRVTHYTNVGTFTLPSDFELDEFRPASDSAMAGLQRWRSHRGWLTKASAKLQTTEFVPKVPAPTLFSDARIPLESGSSEGFSYLTNRWLAKAELLEILKASRMAAGGPMEPRRTVRRAVLLTLFVSTAAFIVAISLKTKRQGIK
ncbi:MAG: hypothetical protein KIS67_24555 [Verrucomicrobiae bacterium]|nr:hypothetical protein [Verrucomicrobiae bacterium]